MVEVQQLEVFEISAVSARRFTGIGAVDVNIGHSRTTVHGDQRCRGANTGSVLRFVAFPRDRSWGSAWSRCATWKCFKSFGIPARPFMGISVVEVQTLGVFYDFGHSRATVHGDQRGRGANTGRVLRLFARATIAWSRCKHWKCSTICGVPARPFVGIKPGSVLRFFGIAARSFMAISVVKVQNLEVDHSWGSSWSKSKSGSVIRFFGRPFMGISVVKAENLKCFTVFGIPAQLCIGVSVVEVHNLEVFHVFWQSRATVHGDQRGRGACFTLFGIPARLFLGSARSRCASWKCFTIFGSPARPVHGDQRGRGACFRFFGSPARPFMGISVVEVRALRFLAFPRDCSWDQRGRGARAGSVLRYLAFPRGLSRGSAWLRCTTWKCFTFFARVRSLEAFHDLWHSRATFQGDQHGRGAQPGKCVLRFFAFPRGVEVHSVVEVRNLDVFYVFLHSRATLPRYFLGLAQGLRKHRCLNLVHDAQHSKLNRQAANLV